MPDKDTEVWETSVEEVMTIFRDALASLAPFLHQARISSKEGEQYDDYDAITELLYEKIVINSIKWSFADSEVEIEIPAYGFEFDPEKHTAFIEVCFESNQELYVFQEVSYERDLFDTVRCYPLGKTQSLFSTGTTYVSREKCSFQVRNKKEDGFDSASALTVIL
ncbi:MAG: hypothetical protein JFAIHJKO_02128 [Pyrinomonadaceae bacterium]|nr:hypothetical protein [Pyrinomonadaceae bacterium]